MTNILRKCAFSLALVCLALTIGTAPALADEPGTEPCVKTQKTTVHKKKAATAKKAKKAKAPKEAKGAALIREAQEHLAHLGYYTGKIDGKMGPRTKAAIKNFQREHGLKVDGILGPKTMKALRDADKVVVAAPPAKEPFKTHEYVDLSPDTNADIHQDYTPPLKTLRVRTIYTRYAGLNVTEEADGVDKRYTVSLNGEPLLMVGGQTSVIGVSKTYDMGDQDAIILTTYNAGNSVCSYGTYVLVMNKIGSRLLEVENCTRSYEAELNKGSLLITFPERDDNRMLGAVWRLEGTTLTRL